MNYYKQKRDANHRDIVEYLRKKGVEVTEILQPLDTLCYHHGKSFLLELKISGSAAKFTRTQLRFIADTKHDVAIATGTDDAWGKIIAREFLSGNAKRRLAALLLRSEKDCYTPREVNEALYP